MKIYPDNSKLMLTDQVNLLTDIPLGYIDSLTKDYNIIINKQIYPNNLRRVIPYETFLNYNYKFFSQIQKNNYDADNFYEVTDEDLLRRVGDLYQYVPKAELSFVPITFDYSVVGKKTATYNYSTSYDLKVGCIETQSNILSKALIKIFGNAPDKGICPPNITVNNKDLMQESLLSGDVRDLDFVFIQSKKGQNYLESNTAIPFDDYLAAHTNVWLCVDDLKPLLNTRLNYKNPILYADSNNTLVATNNIIEKATFQESYLPPPTSEIVMFDHATRAPFIVKEYKDKGYIIISTTDFINQSTENYKLIYEAMLYIYLNMYIENVPITQWICDTHPDYVVKNGELSTENQFKSLKKYYELLGFNNASEVSLVSVNISTSYVKLKSVLNDYVLFEKLITKDNADPQKPDDCISIYTPRQNVIFVKDFIYMIEEDLDKKLIIEKTDSSYILRLNSFKHSSANLNLTSAYNYAAIIPLTKTVDYKEVPLEYGEFNIIAVNNMLIVEDSTLSVVNGHTNSNIIAKAIVTRINSDISIFDMRRRGGGLSDEDAENNFNLLDVGHVEGRSYRKSGTIIFKLPERLKPHNDIIEKAIQDHIVAEKHFIILYE